MADDSIFLRRGAPAFELVLNRPEKRNAISEAMWTALPALLAQAAADPACRALIVRGAGGAFAAGADIAEFEQVYATPERAAAYSQGVGAALDALAAFPKPALAMIEGACVGAGCGVALACDLRFAAEGARFGVTPAKLGLIYPLNDTRRLIEAVGVSAAKDMLFTGRIMAADEALRIGLVDRLCAPGALEDAVRGWCDLAAAASGRSAAEMKRIIAMIRAGADEETPESRAMFTAAFRSDDFREGYRAFLEKREPKFPGGAS